MKSNNLVVVTTGSESGVDRLDIIIMVFVVLLGSTKQDVYLSREGRADPAVNNLLHGLRVSPMQNSKLQKRGLR